MIKVCLEVLCCVMHDSGYINKAVKTISCQFFYFLLETHKREVFSIIFQGKTPILYGKEILHVKN